MPRVEIDQQIHAPPQQVWDFISDIHRGPEWVEVMEEVLSTSDGALGEGSGYRERSRIGPSLSETEWRVTTFDPPQLQVHECHEPSFEAVLTLQVEPEGEGARLVHRTDFRVMPVFRPLGWLLEKAFVHRRLTADLRRSVTTAKRLIEQEATGAGSG